MHDENRSAKGSYERIIDYFLIISLGACWGMLRVLSGRSEIFNHFRKLNNRALTKVK